VSLHGLARRALAALALALLSACATVPASAGGPVGDPWESWNRKVFSFNETVDENVLKPVAQAYRDVVPSFVRTGINNVLNNIYDVWSTANHFLQGKVQSGLEMGMRVLTNTILGAGGLMDPATEIGLTRRSEDFGQTLGRWGLPNGPYVVLPLLGPSTLRDTAGLVVDRKAAPSTLPNTDAGSYAVLATELVNTRANLLSTGALIDQVALDKYSFFRDAYLSRRRDALYDGAPPMETFEDDGADAPPPGAKPGASAPAAVPASAARPAAAASSATPAPR
jgi:phospholipid-binding lipoprotein MlaA